MAPKGKGRGDDLKQEEILQAVVIADSFNVRFGPATDKKPRALLPMINIPLLDHTLDYLSSEGVQETIVFCCHLADQIRTHISNSKYGNGKSSMGIKTVLADGCRSVGDALREIDSRSLLRSDFFLLACDTITNIDLKNMMKEHKTRREVIKSSVMTMAFMEVEPGNRMRCVEDNVLLAVEPVSERICHYQRTTLDKKIRLPMELFQENADFTLHQDLLDSQLYVCSPSVLHLFTDNFDYCSVEDFVKGILISEEILGHTIHVDIFDDFYCARVSNPYMYDVISQDILTNRSHPINPRLILETRTGAMTCHRPNIYQNRGATVASGVHLRQNVVIGKGSSIQTGSEICDSVIGRNCQIGTNVKLEHCYLWDNVTIEEGCSLKNATLCGGVTVYANTTVQQRTILSWNVKVGPDIVLSPNLRLQDTPQKDEFDDDSEKEDDIPEVTPKYGLKSRAFIYTQESGSDDDGERFCTDWGDPLIPGHVSEESEEEEDDDQGSSVTVSDLEEDVEDDDFGQFYSEVMDTLKRAKEERISTENLILEINSLKHAYNIAINNVHQAVMKVLLDVPLCENPNVQGRPLVNAVLRYIETHKGLLHNYVKEKEAQLDCLLSLEDFAVENDRMLSILAKVVHHLYNGDVLEEPAIMQWYQAAPDAEEQEEHARVRKQMEAFITWLAEAEEESDED